MLIQIEKEGNSVNEGNRQMYHLVPVQRESESDTLTSVVKRLNDGER